ncbi:MAG: hypothetical protein V4714_08355 [Bacteroidota bacterium]
MSTQELKEGLKAAGYINSAADENGIQEMNILTYNDLGVYIGEVLEAYGWGKSEAVESNKKWVEYTDGTNKIGHRDFSEKEVEVCYYQLLG